MRKDDLDVGLGTERARFEERLLVVDAALVHVLTSGDVVERIRDDVNAIEERISKDTCTQAPSVLISPHLKIGTHPQSLHRQRA